MTIKICYDVWFVDLPNLCEKRISGDYPICNDGEAMIRFSRMVKIPSHPVRGQKYILGLDPLTDCYESDFEIEESGYIDQDKRVIPYFVIADDYWLHYVLWREDRQKASLPHTIEDWKRNITETEIPKMKEQFKSEEWCFEAHRSRGWC